jgi:hypothetical protein
VGLLGETVEGGIAASRINIGDVKPFATSAIKCDMTPFSSKRTSLMHSLMIDFNCDFFITIPYTKRKKLKI